MVLSWNLGDPKQGFQEIQNREKHLSVTARQKCSIIRQCYGGGIVQELRTKQIAFLKAFHQSISLHRTFGGTILSGGYNVRTTDLLISFNERNLKSNNRNLELTNSILV
ncbi:hypothetical protein NPIL_692411 [Nephila pilipes]|uniref:Uncharacterized protein n=1 Tax=Nephila pilipes TaxID=299642 RepID=A0A8X6TQC8_NEPPI|nr:hypothetical protein NPIL_418111 [Nephila pilipes]GFT36087.1 hypothetical protein NPIL_98621 [Nephila pilipes]GFU04166.1 hypothetical protein NPIL_426221 [Nephila pilipes]GFU47813.1 hypothetical protein NPIL_692411 [Nephila pilipes]